MTAAYWFSALGISLGLTILIEACFALLLGKRGRAMALVVLVNILTNPAAVLVTRLYGLPVLSAEIWAVLAEGFLYKKSRDFSRPYLFSICANALSFGLGLLLNHIL